jgi:hypothetical protein
MDCAKAMAYFYAEKVTLVAIPTTSGSGSEVTDFAVLTHGKVKYPLVDPKICPNVAILDEELLKKTLREAAKGAGRRLRQVEFRTQAPDHPILWGDDESYYLKFYIFQVIEEL